MAVFNGIDDENLNRFDKVFNSTTKLLFNSEFGHSLLSLKEYLTRMIPKPKIKKAGDGSFVYFSSPFYSDSANYISFNKQKPNSNSHISIDDLKDFDEDAVQTVLPSTDTTTQDTTGDNE